MANTLSTLLKTAGDTVGLILPSIANSFGSFVDIYYPISNTSHLGAKGSTIQYGAEPEISEYRLVIGGMLSERFSSDFSLDPYEGESTYILVIGSDETPRNSKVIVHMSEAYTLSYRISSIKIIQGNDAPIYKKLFLKPLEVRV